MAKGLVASTSGSAVSDPASKGSIVSSPKPTDADLAFAFEKKGNVRPQYCFDGRFLYEFDEVKKWFEGNKPSVGYKRHGLVYLRKYCEYREKNPRELCEERRGALRKDPTSTHEETLLNSWHEQRLLPNMMPSTAQGHYSKIVSFFEWNYLKLNIPKFPVVTIDMYKGPKRLRKDEILKMRAFADSERDKLLLCVGSESGFRVRALCSLALGHIVRLEDGSKEGLGCRSRGDLADVMIPCRIQLPERFYYGDKREGITFLCNDAIKELDEYLKHREERGEPINAKTPLFPAYRAVVRTLDNDARVSYWLRDYQQPGSTIRIRQNRPPGPKGRAVGVDALVERVYVNFASFSQLEYIVQNLRVKAAIEWDAEEERPPSVHSLRKYLHSTLDASGVNGHMVNVIIGHTNTIVEHYSGKTHLDYDEVRHAYSSAMLRISITEETNRPRLITLEQKIKLLADRNQFLENSLAEHQTQKDSERQRLEEKVNELARVVDQLVKERKP